VAAEEEIVFSELFIVMKREYAHGTIRGAMEIEVSNALKNEIKKLIIDCLKIPDVTPQEIDDSMSLFEEGNALQIDSIDALEIVMALQRKYSVHIDDQNVGRFIIRSVDTIAEFIAKELAKK
jgi:acyl carrier protein